MVPLSLSLNTLRLLDNAMSGDVAGAGLTILDAVLLAFATARGHGLSPVELEGALGVWGLKLNEAPQAWGAGRFPPGSPVELREREQRLTLWPGARAVDQLPCAGCERWIGGQPLLCDDQLHVLCQVCAPSDLGRPDCPACRAPR
jgi:hypothetical protein